MCIKEWSMHKPPIGNASRLLMLHSLRHSPNPSQLSELSSTWRNCFPKAKFTVNILEKLLRFKGFRQRYGLSLPENQFTCPTFLPDYSHRQGLQLQHPLLLCPSTTDDSLRLPDSNHLRLGNHRGLGTISCLRTRRSPFRVKLRKSIALQRESIPYFAFITNRLHGIICLCFPAWKEVCECRNSMLPRRKPSTPKTRTSWFLRQLVQEKLPSWWKR